MSRALQEITQEIIDLPKEQRLALARVLLDLDEAKDDPNLEAIWDEEIRERIKAYDEGRIQAIPYEELRRKMQNRFAR